MENYTRIIGATSTNIRTPTTGEINQGNDTLTPFDSAKNNGYSNEMSQQLGDVSTELTNLISAAGLTPDATLGQVLEAIPLISTPITTEGDLMRGDASGKPERLPLGAANEILSSNGTNLTWSAVPVSPGGIVQTVKFQTGAVATGTNQIPADNSPPLNTDGDQYMSQVITPTKSTNELEINIVFFGTTDSSGDRLAVALFQDSIVDSLATGVDTTSAANRVLGVVYSHTMLAGSTSPITFKVRAGGNTGNTTFNGQSSGGLYGGTLRSSITIIETEV